MFETNALEGKTITNSTPQQLSIRTVSKNIAVKFEIIKVFSVFIYFQVFKRPTRFLALGFFTNQSS
jgi:hypothetical protein